MMLNHVCWELESMGLPLCCFLHDIYFQKYMHIIIFLHDINLFFFGVPKMIWMITTMIESLKSIYLMHLKLFPELLVSRNIFWIISFSFRYHRHLETCGCLSGCSDLILIIISIGHASITLHHLQGLFYRCTKWRVNRKSS